MHYTDLRPYYRDLRRLPRLADEEQRRLLATLSTPRTQQCLPAQEETHLKHRLIEGHLGLAARIAREECPPNHYQALPDLVQEANLAVMLATEHFTSTSGVDDFTAYVAAWARARVKSAVSRAALPIAVPYRVRQAAQQAGTIEQFYWLQPVSLDRLGDKEDADGEGTLLACLSAPATPVTPPRDDTKRALVERLLSYLSPREQAVLRLRHGLVAEDDERPRTRGEIARTLGIAPGDVPTYERDALRRLRALVAGEAQLVPYRGRLAISLCGADAPRLSAQKRQDIAQERREQLLQAYQRFNEQGIKITVDRLAEATGVPSNLVAAFLHELRGQPSYRTGTAAQRAQARQCRLEEEYRKLVAAGITPSGEALARLAHTRKETARAFLKARKHQQATCCAVLGVREKQT